MGDTGENVIWNFDDNEAELIFSMKMEFIHYRDLWDLESAYWSLLKLLSESEPIFDESVKKDLNDDFDKISEKRKECDKFTNIDEEEKGDIWNQLNLLYRKLCNEMVEKDYYFRRKKTYTGL